MGLLKTSPEWRGEGCAKACINNLAYHMDTLGITPHVYIEEDNVGSISLFEKMGYVKMHGASWIGFLPKKQSSTHQRVCSLRSTINFIFQLNPKQPPPIPGEPPMPPSF